ncbi:(2E,6E)-farnesyl diphosphate synthase [Pseudoalteromonas aurantia]|uniref:Farnesyl diphosphate synthase n=1 Tax=Pseudoalteromonas aurantia 208 TaxID=1314867 RepID=A0ABR9E889_9GAMM|nr:farnesyl diphosphate synthase [Pseudoalteromonas aurantia]MBE0367201.1 farnesyl diphosphate synthase [Pseudoalteromonas aurantia 208]
MNLKIEISNAQQRVSQFISNYFKQDLITDETVKAATFYSINNGGKRLRPFLVYATGNILGARIEDLDVIAAAIECIHSYSLVHDDLPAMDDDDLRRGKPTCHIQFNEAQAILAGDALQSLAFELIAEHRFAIPESRQLRMIQVLSKAAGLQGMVGGQALDIAATDKVVSLDELEKIHRLKTGALLTCAIELGALCSPNMNETDFTTLQQYGQNIGLAFQVQDDILDIEGDTYTLGKPQGSDIGNNKSTYPAILGMPGAKQKAQALTTTAIEKLNSINADTELLAQLAKYIVERDH